MKNKNGFTLIEVMVSLGLLGIVSTSMTSGFINHMQTNTAMERRSGAFAAAQVVLDDLRFQDPASLPGSGSTTPTTYNIGGRDFEVTNFYCLDSTLCPSTNTRHIKVEVRYRGEKLYEVETVYTRLK